MSHIQALNYDIVLAAVCTLSPQITPRDDAEAAVKVQGLTVVTPGQRSMWAAVSRVLGAALTWTTDPQIHQLCVARIFKIKAALLSDQFNEKCLFQLA